MSGFLKGLVSTALCFSFGVVELVWATPGAFSATVPAVASPSAQSVTSLPLSQISKLQIPLEFATLNEFHQGTNGKLLIHIQDAHSNLSGQKSLAGVLDLMMTRYGTKLVLVEGSSTDVTLDALKKIGTREQWKRAANRLLYEGLISGEEFLNLTSDHSMRLVGIESQDLYQQSLEVYADLVAKREKTSNYLRRIRMALDRVKNKLYPQELLRFEAERRANEDDFNDHLGRLLDLAEKAGVTISGDFGETAKLVGLKAREKQIDFAAANRDQERLMNAVLRGKTEDERKSILEAARRARTQPVAMGAFVQSLLETTGDPAAARTLYPALAAYADYLDAFGLVRMDHLLEELDLLEDTVYKILLASSEDARMTRACDRFLGLLEKAYKIKMSSTEFALLKLNEEDFPTKLILGFLNRKLLDLGFLEDLTPYQTPIEDTRATLDKFYELVSKRDYAFLEKTKQAIDDSDQKAVFVIAGGYHTEHLTSLWREQGYSYAVLTPVVQYETDQQKYESLLLAPIKYSKYKNKVSSNPSYVDIQETPDPSKVTDGIRKTALNTVQGAATYGARFAAIAQSNFNDIEARALTAELRKVAENKDPQTRLLEKLRNRGRAHLNEKRQSILESLWKKLQADRFDDRTLFSIVQKSKTPGGEQLLLAKFEDSAGIEPELKIILKVDPATNAVLAIYAPDGDQERYYKVAEVTQSPHKPTREMVPSSRMETVGNIFGGISDAEFKALLNGNNGNILAHLLTLPESDLAFVASSDDVIIFDESNIFNDNDAFFDLCAVDRRLFFKSGEKDFGIVIHEMTHAIFEAWITNQERNKLDRIHDHLMQNHGTLLKDVLSNYPKNGETLGRKDHAYEDGSANLIHEALAYLMQAVVLNRPYAGAGVGDMYKVTSSDILFLKDLGLLPKNFVYWNGVDSGADAIAQKDDITFDQIFIFAKRGSNQSIAPSVPTEASPAPTNKKSVAYGEVLQGQSKPLEFSGSPISSVSNHGSFNPSIFSDFDLTGVNFKELLGELQIASPIPISATPTRSMGAGARLAEFLDISARFGIIKRSENAASIQEVRQKLGEALQRLGEIMDQFAHRRIFDPGKSFPFLDKEAGIVDIREGKLWVGSNSIPLLNRRESLSMQPDSQEAVLGPIPVGTAPLNLNAIAGSRLSANDVAQGVIRFFKRIVSNSRQNYEFTLALTPRMEALKNRIPNFNVRLSNVVAGLTRSKISIQFAEPASTLEQMASAAVQDSRGETIRKTISFMNQQDVNDAEASGILRELEEKGLMASEDELDLIIAILGMIQLQVSDRNARMELVDLLYGPGALLDADKDEIKTFKGKIDVIRQHLAKRFGELNLGEAVLGILETQTKA